MQLKKVRVTRKQKENLNRCEREKENLYRCEREIGGSKKKVKQQDRQNDKENNQQMKI